MIQEFEKYDNINEGFFGSIRKLFSFIKKDSEVKDAIKTAVEEAGKDAVHLFLYDLSKDSDLKEYNNTKNKHRKNIERTKRIEDRNKSRKQKAEDAKKLRKVREEEAKKYNTVKDDLKSLVGNVYNVKILDRGLDRSHLYKLHDVLTNKKNKRRSKAELEIIEDFSKSIALDELDETKTKEYLDKIKTNIVKKKLKWN